MRAKFGIEFGALIFLRVKSFIWILKHDRLLTNDRISLSSFGMDGCSLYGAVHETSLHVLRDCRVVKGVWDCIVPNSVKSTFFLAGWQDWLQLNLFSELLSFLDRCHYWAITCNTFWT